MKSFGLLDLLGAGVTTVFVVATMMALPMGWVRAACLAGGVVGFAAGYRMAKPRSWEYKLLWMPLATLLGMLVGGIVWGIV